VLEGEQHMKDARNELVRIDDDGVAHAIGTVASQRMRQREGAYRMLPAPQHVVFMRYTGEDGRRDDGDGAVVRIAGEIASAGCMLDILALVAQAGWKGVLTVFGGDSKRSILFDQGNVVGVQTSEEKEWLGSVLYQYGGLTAQQLQEVTAQMSEGRRFGEVAVELGFLTSGDVFKFIRRQVEEVVYATLTVEDGTFFFLDGIDESRRASTQVVSANALLMDGVTRLDELRYFREKVPNSQYVPEKVPAVRPPAEDCLEVFQAIDGKRSVQEIGRVTALGEFETTKAIYTLMQSKHVVLRPPRLSGGTPAVVAAANDVLRAVFKTMQSEGRTDDLRLGLNSFAVGAGVYDMLFRGAGPDESGCLDAETVADNAGIVAAGEDPETILKHLLHDYVSFALFSVGAILGKDTETRLTQQVSQQLTNLRPGA
jgi:hypothetical protein